MNTTQNSLLSLYHQVEDYIRNEIAEGTWSEGDLIPSEIELSKKYEVSQGTVRKAILNLTQKGLLYRKQGKGTFVVFPKMVQGRYRNFRFVEGLNSELVNVDLSLQKIDIIYASADIATNLQIRKGTKVFLLERMGIIADNNYLHTLSFLPHKLYKGLDKFNAEDFYKNTLWKLQDVHFGVRIENREEFISVNIADRNMAKNLNIKIGNPILCIELKLTSFTGEIVEYRLSHCKPDNLKFYIPE
ncbi:GntR family transcriptional regulator [Thermodesulfobacteriota bacterium]